MHRSRDACEESLTCLGASKKLGMYIGTPWDFPTSALLVPRSEHMPDIVGMGCGHGVWTCGVNDYGLQNIRGDEGDEGRLSQESVVVCNGNQRSGIRICV